MVGLYGYDTKDFIIGAHERLADDNADGVIDNKDQPGVGIRSWRRASSLYHGLGRRWQAGK